jgi:histidyl-tRNA synthetase
MLLLMARGLEAIGIRDYRIHVSHRGLYNRFLSGIGLAEQAAAVLRIVDKLKKVGEEEVRATRAARRRGPNAERILSFIRPAERFEDTLSGIEAEIGGQCEEVARLREIWSCIRESGLQELFFFDPSITRGLDYYTGVVFETFLQKIPEIGSVCSGGATTTWPPCTPPSACRGSAPRSVWTGCWPPSKRWSCCPRWPAHRT